MGKRGQILRQVELVALVEVKDRILAGMVALAVRQFQDKRVAVVVVALAVTLVMVGQAAMQVQPMDQQDRQVQAEVLEVVVQVLQVVCLAA